MLRLDLEFIKDITLSPFINWRQSQYHDATTRLTRYFGEDDRSDNLLITGVGLTWQFSENLGVEVGWQYLKSYSSSPFYRYDSTRSTLASCSPSRNPGFS